MLNVVATFELNDPGKLQVIPAASPTEAAPKVTRAQAGPEVAPFPHYVKVVGTPAV
jgi:hypothetical protein